MAVALTCRDVPLQVILFASIEKGDPGSFETYATHPLATSSPYKEETFYTFIRQSDWESQLGGSTNFTGRITSSTRWPCHWQSK